MFRMEIGNAIRFLRKQKGYTQSQLADFSHTTKSTISNLESGHQSYSAALLQHLSKALDCPISKIFLIAEHMAEDGSAPAWERLPVEVLFDELSRDAQTIIKKLMQQMVIERER